jgi:hypothetical protein
MPRIIYRTIIVLTYLLIPIHSYSQIQRTQAAFIYNFALFINWPLEYQVGDFEIAVLGNTELIKELELLAKDKKIGEQQIKVKKVLRTSDIGKANILFIPDYQGYLIKDALKATDQTATLVIAEMEGLGKKGGIVNFIKVDEKLKFELNIKEAERRGLKVPEKLIKLGIPIN